MAQLADPNVDTVHDAGTSTARCSWPWSTIPGATLGQWASQRPTPLARGAGVYRQAGLGLAAAHRAGLVHRDVKPDNLLLGEDGRVRVTDFGLVSSAGEVVEPASGEFAGPDRKARPRR